MRLTPLERAQRDIEHALVFGGALEKSTFGLMVERAELYAFAKVTQMGDDLAYRLPALKEGGMRVKETRGEGGYEVNEELAKVVGRGTRWLMLVGARSRQNRFVLEVFYGDRDLRGRRAVAATNRGGIDDPTFVLWPMTRMGIGWLTALRAKSSTSASLRPDELLATELVLQRVTPTEPRRLRLAACDAQARQLLGLAHAGLQAVAEEAEMARQQRVAAREERAA